MLGAFDQGMTAGLQADPHPRPDDPRTSQPRQRITTLRSPWLHQRCDVCGHSFRLGDTVLALPRRRALHAMPGLRCASASPAASPAANPAANPATSPKTAAPESPSSRAASFYDGLISAWPMPDEVPLTRLEAGHPLLAPPHRGHGRAACRVCGHTFRPLDLVVICPCDPLNPRCRAAVHRDVLKQLHCWDLWQQSPHRDNACIGMS